MDKIGMNNGQFVKHLAMGKVVQYKEKEVKK